MERLGLLPGTEDSDCLISPSRSFIGSGFTILAQVLLLVLSGRCKVLRTVHNILPMGSFSLNEWMLHCAASPTVVKRLFSGEEVLGFVEWDNTEVTINEGYGGINNGILQLPLVIPGCKSIRIIKIRWK